MTENSKGDRNWYILLAAVSWLAGIAFILWTISDYVAQAMDKALGEGLGAVFLIVLALFWSAKVKKWRQQADNSSPAEKPT
jgi:hypothetical protein